ncbi:hypothetical protein YC2023_083854 [Brassica napus]
MVVLSLMHHICMASKYWIPMTQGGYLSLFLLQILLSKETCTEQYHILNRSITSGHTSISNNFPANQLFYQSHLVETARSACRTTKYAIWWASYGIPKSLPFAFSSHNTCKRTENHNHLVKTLNSKMGYKRITNLLNLPENLLWALAQRLEDQSYSPPAGTKDNTNANKMKREPVLTRTISSIPEIARRRSREWINLVRIKRIKAGEDESRGRDRFSSRFCQESKSRDRSRRKVEKNLGMIFPQID